MNNGGQPLPWDLRQNYKVKISLQDILASFQEQIFKRTAIV